MTLAIINGKRYNTETAEMIAENGSNGLSTTDFRWWSEELYRTKTGSWFTCGSGGPMTRYSVPLGNNGRSGSCNVIRPITDKEAQSFLEDVGAVEMIERYFDVTDA